MIYLDKHIKVDINSIFITNNQLFFIFFIYNFGYKITTCIQIIYLNILRIVGV